MHLRRLNRKGVDTILATLLLVLIVIVASVIVYSWSVGVFGNVLPPPAGGREAVTLEWQAWTGNSNVTLFIRDTGSAVTTFTGYFVQDGNGNEYACISISCQGPTVTPGSLAIVKVVIPPLCSNCQLTGSNFYFQSGNVYNIILVTQKNSQFPYTILR